MAIIPPSKFLRPKRTQRFVSKCVSLYLHPFGNNCEMHYGEIFLPLELGLLKKYDSLDMAPTRTFEVPILNSIFFTCGTARF